MVDPLSHLIGLTLKEVTVNKQDDVITYTSECGQQFRMLHHNDCCETVYIEDVEGDINDLIGSPILVAETVQDAMQQAMNLIIPLPEKNGECEQWTFYRLATAKGWVVIRWYGDSNGYYSTDVSFERVSKDAHPDE